jgi:hypothetical protein
VFISLDLPVPFLETLRFVEIRDPKTGQVVVRPVQEPITPTPAGVMQTLAWAKVGVEETPLAPSTEESGGARSNTAPVDRAVIVPPPKEVFDSNFNELTPVGVRQTLRGLLDVQIRDPRERVTCGLPRDIMTTPFARNAGGASLPPPRNAKIKLPNYGPGVKHSDGTVGTDVSASATAVGDRRRPREEEDTALSTEATVESVDEPRSPKPSVDSSVAHFESPALQLCQLEVYRHLKAAALSPAAQKRFGLVVVKGSSDCVELLHHPSLSLPQYRKLIISLSKDGSPTIGKHLLAKFWRPAARSVTQLISEGYCIAVQDGEKSLEDEYRLEVRLSSAASLTELKAVPSSSVPMLHIPPTLARQLAAEYLALESKVADLVNGKQTSSNQEEAANGLDEAASLPRQLDAMMALHKRRTEDVTLEVLRVILGV